MSGGVRCGVSIIIGEVESIRKWAGVGRCAEFTPSQDLPPSIAAGGVIPSGVKSAPMNVDARDAVISLMLARSATLDRPLETFDALLPTESTRLETRPTTERSKSVAETVSSSETLGWVRAVGPGRDARGVGPRLLPGEVTRNVRARDDGSISGSIMSISNAALSTRFLATDPRIGIDAEAGLSPDLLSYSPTSSRSELLRPPPLLDLPYR